MRILKTGVVILSFLTYVTLLSTVLYGCFFTTDTLVWINIRCWELITYDKTAVWLFVAPLISIATLLVKAPKKSKVIILMLSLFLGEFVYTDILLTTLQEFSLIAETISLHPGYIFYPIVLNLEIIFALFVVLFYKDKREENYNDIDGTIKCVGESLR